MVDAEPEPVTRHCLRLTVYPYSRVSQRIRHLWVDSGALSGCQRLAALAPRSQIRGLQAKEVFPHTSD